MGVSVETFERIPLTQLDDAPRAWVQDVVKDGLCSGCGLCEVVSRGSYRMQNIEAIGFRPVKIELSSPDLEVGSFCPGIFLHRDQAQTSEHSASLWEDWGPVLEVWEGFATDPVIRHRGSSGGAVTALAQFADQALNMQVAGTVANRQDPFINEVAGADRLAEMSGSRYAPSSPCVALNADDEAEPIAFIGKPCDVGGLHNLNRLRNAHPDSFSVGIFCAGVPSVAGNRALVQDQGLDPAQVTELKYRGEGWPGLWRAVTGDGQRREMTYADSWHFLQRFRQWRCYLCPDHTGEFADIAVGDPWYKTRVAGEGKSLIVVRTLKGQGILRRAMAAGYIDAYRLDDAKLPASQPGLLATRSSIIGRLFAMRLFGLTPVRFTDMGLGQAWRREVGAVDKLRAVVSTARRLLRKGIVRWQ